MTPTFTPPLPASSPAEKLTLAVVAGGLLALLLALADANPDRRHNWFWLALGLVSAGTLTWSWLKYGRHPAGVQQDNLWLRASTGRGAVAWVTGLVLTGFYVVLYWFSNGDGQGNFGLLSNLVHPLDGLSHYTCLRKPHVPGRKTLSRRLVTLMNQMQQARSQRAA